jgi:copper chaperone NosL
MKFRAVFLLTNFVFTGCAIEIDEIEYGHDTCSYCTMMIMDKKHPSQIVTNKGKVFKYDSIECMIRAKRTLDEESLALQKVMDFSTGEFIDAHSASFLISPHLPSPMGANLSAFESLEEAKKVKAEKEGELYTWNSVQKVVN